MTAVLVLQLVALLLPLFIDEAAPAIHFRDDATEREFDHLFVKHQQPVDERMDFAVSGVFPRKGSGKGGGVFISGGLSNSSTGVRRLV